MASDSSPVVHHTIVQKMIFFTNDYADCITTLYNIWTTILIKHSAMYEYDTVQSFRDSNFH